MRVSDELFSIIQRDAGGPKYREVEVVERPKLRERNKVDKDIKTLDSLQHHSKGQHIEGYCYDILAFSLPQCISMRICKW